MGCTRDFELVNTSQRPILHVRCSFTSHLGFHDSKDQDLGNKMVFKSHLKKVLHFADECFVRKKSILLYIYVFIL